MDIRELAVPGAWVITPRQHRDERGAFLEWFKAGLVAESIGHQLTVAQANHSISREGVLRGVHYADVPPGQAKYVYCSKGALLDVIVDVRVGSPTFGQHAMLQLDDVDRRGVYLSEGLGHAILALTDDANATYLCSTPFDPRVERGVHPLDPALGINWPVEHPRLSDKDAAAPTLAQAADAGLLPAYADCERRYDALRSETVLRGGQ